MSHLLRWLLLPSLAVGWGTGCATVKTPRKKAAMVRPFILNTYARARLQLSADGQEQGLNDPGQMALLPNSRGALGVAVGKGGTSFSVTQDPEPDPESVEEKGETEYSDFQFHTVQGHYGLDIFLQGYKGYFLDPPTAVNPNYQEGDPYPQYPDMSINRRGVSLFYVFHPKDYVYNAAFSQTQFQKSSGWSVITFISANNYRVKGIPTELTSQYAYQFEDPENADFEVTSYSWVIGPCFTLKSSYGPFLSGILGILGASYQYFGSPSELWDADRNGGSKSTFRVSAGIDRGWWFMGALMVSDSENFHDKSLQVGVESEVFEYFVGFRR